MLLEVVRPEGSVRGERANFTKLVLGCIEANFASKYSLDNSRRDLHNALESKYSFALFWNPQSKIGGKRTWPK